MLRALLTNPNLRWFLLAVVAVVGAWLSVTTFSSSHQLANAQEELLESIEDGDWEELESLIHDNYKDQWGHDKAETMDTLKNFRRAFLTLNIEMDITTTYRIKESGDATVTGDATVNGSGGLSSQVRQHLHSISTPFEFEWRKTSFWPWSWKLMSVKNEDLKIPAGFSARIRP